MLNYKVEFIKITNKKNLQSHVKFVEQNNKKNKIKIYLLSKKFASKNSQWKNTQKKMPTLKLFTPKKCKHQNY